MKKKLEIGFRKFDLELRSYEMFTEFDDFSILYLSDLHLNRYSNKIISEIIKTIRREKVDFILFGGDYIDELKGLSFLDQIFKEAIKVSTVFAILGNHDRLFFKSKVIECINENRVKLIEKQSYSFYFKNTEIQIDGNITTQKNNDTKHFKIACFHKPKTIKYFKGNYNLVLSGHLHGCQIILWGDENGYYPGKYFYKNNVGKYSENKFLYLVSKGLGDTLPIRFNCQKDILRINVKGNSQ